LNEQVVLLPLVSVTLNVFIVVPIGNVTLLAKPAIWAVVEPRQLSVPTGAVYVIIAPHTLASLLLVMFEGHVITGAVVSNVIVTLPLADALQPGASP
jgi:hypothetical protein